MFMKVLLSLVLLLFAHSGWHVASEAELHQVIPARAPVESERIETEFRTASGISDDSGRSIAGVVLITAGYSAEGKYSHYFVTQVPLAISDFKLKPGQYVFNARHEGDGLTVKFFEARTGQFVGTARAERQSRIGRIESFRITPPAEGGLITIGRFGFPYRFVE